MELRASLLDRDAILEAAGGREPKQRTAFESEFIPFSELGVGSDGNSDVGRLAGGHSRKPLSSDADDRERVACYANLFADDVGRAAKAASPELVAEHGDLGTCAAARIGIFGD